MNNNFFNNGYGNNLGSNQCSNCGSGRGNASNDVPVVETVVQNSNEEVRVGGFKDHGPKPFVVNLQRATLQNENFRNVFWTGKHLQLTLMSIKPGEEIGLEMHPNVDQFLQIVRGQGSVKMGSKDNLSYRRNVSMNDAIIIPAGTWHNLANTGRVPLKLFSIYAPPNHPFGTVHPTKEDADRSEY